MGQPVFSFQVVTPQQAEPERPLVSLQVPAADGRLTVLAGHQSLICALDEGMCVLRDADGMRTLWRCGDGALEIGSDGRVTLLISRWVPATDEELEFNKAGTVPVEGD